jgi:tetratricopeptide (TPR) repeat protein
MPPRNPYFTGRAGLLGEMHRRLHAAGTAVAILPLQGMSGVGKSQLAVEYAHRHAAEFQLAWWVNAENRIVAASGLLELAEALGLPSGAQPTVLRQLWAALGERDDWLLVYDNVIDPAGLTVLRPPDTGRLLITGRSPLIGRLSTVVEVAEFSRDESIALLRLRCPTLSDEGADQVAAALGDLPLAVEQAGCYLADTGLEVSDYLRLLATQPAEAGLAEGTVDRHPGLASVVTASRVRLQALDPRAAALLDQLAFFAAEPLPLVPYYRDQQSHRFGVQIGDAAKTGAVVREITRLGLAHHRGTTIQLHRLVQALLRARLSATEQAISRHAAQQVVGSANPGTPDDPTSWPAYATLTPHVQALIEPSELNGAALEPEPDQFRTLFLNITRYLFLSGQYLVGRDLASYAHRHWSQTLGPDHPDALHASNRLAAVLSGLGDYETACELLTDALTRRRRVLGDDHIDTIGSANNLAIVMGRLGEYAGARDLLQDTIERQRRVLGDDHPATLYSVNNLADTLYWLGDYAAARDLLDDTIALRRQVLGVEDPHTLYSAASLAEVLGALGEYASARDVLKDVLPRQRRVVGPDHPDTLYSTGVLAKVLSGLGELAAAREVLTDTLIRQRRLLGNDHPDTRKTEDDLAQLEPALSPSPLDDEESTRSGPREQ